ncbi:glycosyltransferase family 2 protein [Loktanella salsilacus]|uniref:glycosyltransferase family 2 protein n=1 Tax=Loktanella salsilacus TaxID=195913 RepID=UPI0037355080
MPPPASLTVVILTRDEERHLPRALASVAGFADRILVVDSGSTDRTVEIAEAAGATVLHNPWVNHASQMNWAFDYVPKGTDWVMRLDADEIVLPELGAEIRDGLPGLGLEIDGVYVSRRINFLGGSVRYGGLFPVRVLRLVRNGRGRCENRWMDEHLIVEGAVADFWGELVDDNLKPLTWWIDKHNAYASREVVDILNLEYGFMPHETIATLNGGRQANVKRWLKEKLYARLPTGLRAGAYFFYRFVIRLGFLDTREGRMFHVLQGFWYRYLVDSKLTEVRRYIVRNGVGPAEAIQDVLGITLPPQKAQR